MDNPEKKMSLLEESRQIKKISNIWYWVFGVIVVTAPFLYAVISSDKGVDTVVIETAKVEKGDIVLSVSASGRVVPLNDIDLHFPNSGILKQLLVSEGDYVKAGQIIAKLDTREAELLLTQAQITLDIATANLNVEIDTREGSVTAETLALEVAEVDLLNTINELALKEPQNQRDLSNEYEQDIIKMSASSDVFNNTLLLVDKIFGIDSESTLGLGVSEISAGNPQYLIDTKSNYLLARESYERFLIEFNKQKTNFDREVFTDVLDQSIDIAKKINKSIQSGLNAVEESVVSNQLSQSTIDSTISDFQAQQTKVKNEVLVLTEARQEIIELQTKGKEDILVLNQDIRDLKLKVETAKQDMIIVDTKSRSEYLQARVAVDLANNRYNDLLIRAPFGGNVVEINYRVGEVIGIDKDIPVAVVSNTEGITIEAFVEESDIVNIETGQEAIITFDAIRDISLEGLVTFVSEKSTIDANGIVNYKVIISSSDVHEKVREGMTTNVDIISSGVRDVLVIPVAAVKPREGKPSVQLESGVWVSVLTGFTDGKKVEVIEGVKRGDTIQYEQ